MSLASSLVFNPLATARPVKARRAVSCRKPTGACPTAARLRPWAARSISIVIETVSRRVLARVERAGLTNNESLHFLPLSTLQSSRRRSTRMTISAGA